MRRVIDMIQMSNCALGVTYVRTVKHETRAGRLKFVASGKYPTVTKPLVKARVCARGAARVFHFHKISRAEKGRNSGPRPQRGRVAWPPPDAESVRRGWEDWRLCYEDKVRMKEEWNTKSYLRHGIPRPQCARSFEIYFARLAWKIYLLELTSGTRT